MKLTVSKNIETLIPYPPGKPLKELEREYGISDSIKMASNENSLGPSSKAVEAIKNALGSLHRYPDGSCYYLAQALAAKIGVKPEELVFGNGSNEIIELLVGAFVAPGDEVISSQPSFLVYQTMVQARDGVNRVVPLKEMCHDLEGISAEITSKTKLIFLDNPNNPTGTVFNKQTFEAFLSKVPESVIVVLDEAYVDFVEDSQRLDMTSYLGGKHPVVGLRTFSKAYGLAGLRVGYGIMPQEIASYLHRVRQPFNVNELAQVGALACLEDEDHYTRTLAMTREGFNWLSKEINKLGCRTFPTQTNFFLVDIQSDCKQLYDAMLHKGVIIRPMSAYGFPSYIRITVGTRAENERLLKALAASLAEIKNG
ncbi:MAG: histidinol-phosphate transaminase [Desulfobulbaceae bacterium]|uniref:Histidinol-phosphate aminotransferase n=1 Tax=Candidatus Desulfobia pelagia TaxID=2841692 RepID=A0A8J6TD17_9BACT|nr:histidinol-phosphate transaminase [Candidatus Desulfobia pelagia]